MPAHAYRLSNGFEQKIIAFVVEAEFVSEMTNTLLLFFVHKIH